MIPPDSIHNVSICNIFLVYSIQFCSDNSSVVSLLGPHVAEHVFNSKVKKNKVRKPLRSVMYFSLVLCWIVNNLKVCTLTDIAWNYNDSVSIYLTVRYSTITLSRRVNPYFFYGTPVNTFFIAKVIKVKTS